jgi:hypothetical protein
MRLAGIGISIGELQLVKRMQLLAQGRMWGALVAVQRDV